MEWLDSVQNIIDVSDDDDDRKYAEHVNRPRRPKTFRERNDLFNTWDDVDFHVRFRLSKNMCVYSI